MSNFKADADWAFTQYERVRDTLPSADFPASSVSIANLGEVADNFDVFLLDAFGVLNVGNTPISGAPQQIAALQEMGKTTIVITNGASFPADASLKKYTEYGFNFSPETVISSRNILFAGLASQPSIRWGAMALPSSKLEDASANICLLGDDKQHYDEVEGFIFLSSLDITPERRDILFASLKENPRPILVGNPDIVAPREDDFSLEPGWYGHEAARATGIAPQFYGKPFLDIFTEARKRVPASIPNHRIAMVGDTLHTDILGGKAAGFGTILISGHGLFRGKDVYGYIKASGIVPDFIAPTT